MQGLRQIMMVPLLSTLAFGGDVDRWKFGFAVHGVVPIGTLSSDTDHKLGAGVSVISTYRLSDKQALRPRLDVDILRLQDRKDDDRDTHAHTDFSRWGGGVDYLYYPGGNQDKGWFLSAGAGIHRWRLDEQSWVKGSSSTLHTQNTTHNRTAMSVSAGLGHQLTKVTALELRASTSPYNRPSRGDFKTATGDTAGGSAQGTILQLAGTFRW